MGPKETLGDAGVRRDLRGSLDMHQGGIHGLFNMKNTCLRMNQDKRKAPETEQQGAGDYILVKGTWKPFVGYSEDRVILKSFRVQSGTAQRRRMRCCWKPCSSVWEKVHTDIRGGKHWRCLWWESELQDSARVTRSKGAAILPTRSSTLSAPALAFQCRSPLEGARVPRKMTDSRTQERHAQGASETNVAICCIP